MLVSRYRLAVAGVVTATAIAVPAVALASVPGSSAGKPAPPQASAPSVTKSPAPQGSAPGPGKSPEPSSLAALAASAGITVRQLEGGLEAAKQAGGNTAAGVAAFAASTGVSQVTAQRVMDAMFGAGVSKQPGQSAQPVNALAAALGVSHAAAQRALDQIEALGRGGIDPASPAFAVIARELGVNPARLTAALDAVKQGLAGK